jgi:tRNA-binding EMAP/Myf-like protein
MFTKSENHNINYLATVTQITHLRPHPNADRLKVCTIYGNNVITGTTANEGDLVIYFPIECTISKEFLSYTNSFEDVSLNADPKKKGFFNKHGRVRAINLRGSKSEGYIIPVKELEIFAKQVLGKTIVIDGTYEGTDFDTIFDHLLVKKYVPANQRTPNESIGKKTKGNVKKYASKLVDNQFQFHPSTEHLKKCIRNINFNDSVVITEKYHGTSFVVSNVLVKRKLTLWDRIAKYLGVSVVETEYGMLYSSRSVLKNALFHDEKEHNHYYDADVWKIAAEKLYPFLKQGYSFYGEIVGYTPTGAMIQKNYDYGCPEGSLECVVYRMTFTNPNGDVFELSHDQMVTYCNNFNIKTPFIHYQGKIRDLYNFQDNVDWHNELLKSLIDDYLEKDCMFCSKIPNIPAEGIVLRNDKPNQWEVYKLKSFRFLEKETQNLDRGEIDIETAESI